MRILVNTQWFYSEDEIDAAYNAGYADGKELALEEYPLEPVVSETNIDVADDYSEFETRSEKHPYHDVWFDNERLLGLFKHPFSKYHLTKSKIVVEKGFFTEISEPILLYRVIKSTTNIRLIQRLFGIGDIKLKTANHEYILKNVYQPKLVNAVILKYVDLNRKDRVRMSEWSKEMDVD